MYLVSHALCSAYGLWFFPFDSDTDTKPRHTGPLHQQQEEVLDESASNNSMCPL